MPITTTCGGRGKAIEAPESAAGRKARCPQCGVVVVMVIPGEPVVSAGPVGGVVPGELVAGIRGVGVTAAPAEHASP